MAGEHRFTRPQPPDQDVLGEAAAEVILSVERLYYEGRLDMALCGMPPHSPDIEPVVLLDKIASQIAIDIGRNNYTLLAKTCVDAFVAWARANPLLDKDEVISTKLRWEGHSNNQSLGDLARAL